MVEPAGIEPASDSAKPGLLRAQSVEAFSQSRHSYRQVADELSHSECSPRAGDEHGKQWLLR